MQGKGLELSINGGMIQNLGESTSCYLGNGINAYGEVAVNLTNVYFDKVYGWVMDARDGGNGNQPEITFEGGRISNSGGDGCGGSTTIDVNNGTLIMNHTQMYDSRDNGISISDSNVQLNSVLIRGMTNGIYQSAGSLTIENSTFDYNHYGVYVASAGSSAKIRGTRFDDNQRGIVTVVPIDLGTVNDPGNNVFSRVISTNLHPGISASGNSSYTISAVGNTWIALEQGADSQGKYPSSLMTGPQDGKNFQLSANHNILF